MKANRFFVLLLAAMVASPLAASDAQEAPPDLTWVPTGGPIGGLGYDIRMHPDDPDLMYVTDAFAGVFISRDGGENWAPSNEGIAARSGSTGDAIPVFCLTIDPNNPDIIWVGTQNIRGIFKSVDGGRTWVEKTSGIVESEGVSFRGFAVDPRSSQIVYAAAEISSWVWAGEERRGREFDMTRGVVYKTVDGGENWAAVWRGDNLARYVLIDPRDSDVLYVSTGIFDREAANSDPVAGVPGGEGVLKSTDGGATWHHANNGLGNLYVGSLHMHPTNPDILLAGTGNNQYFENATAYLTTDGGSIWEKAFFSDSGVHSVEFATADPNIAYSFGSGAIYRSQDGGHSWMEMSAHGEGWGPPGIRAGFPIDIQVDPRDPNRIFANNYGGGNFLSVDGGRTWEMASRGYTGAQIRDLAVASDAAGRVYVAARSGLFSTRDGGGDWTGILYEEQIKVLEWNAVAVDPTDPGHIVAGTNWDSFLAASSDAGRSWDVVARDHEGIGWRAVAFAPSDSSVVYAGTGAYRSAGSFSDDLPAVGVLVSRDGGASWSDANDETSDDAQITSFAVQSSDPSVVYAATTRNGVLKSVNSGASWSKLPTGVGDGVAAYSIALDPADSEMVLVGFANRGVIRSSDGGATWQPSSAGLAPESMITDIVFHPTQRSVVFASDLWSGVHRSIDGGQGWNLINDGLLNRAVSALDISVDGRHLYAGTEGGGVFRLDLDGEPPATAPSLSADPDDTGASVTTTSEVSPEPTTSSGTSPEPTTGSGDIAAGEDADGAAFSDLPSSVVDAIMRGLTAVRRTQQ